MRYLAVFSILMVLVAVTPALAGDEEAKALYEKKCGMCHGKDGVAKKMGAGSADLNDPEWQAATSLDAIIKVTAEGKGKMPKYTGKLSDDQIKMVAEYILTLKPTS